MHQPGPDGCILTCLEIFADNANKLLLICYSGRGIAKNYEYYWIGKICEKRSGIAKKIYNFSAR